MAGHNYVTKGYSTYTNIPSREPRYDYIVETTTIERVRGPIVGPAQGYSGSPSKIELLKEYVHVPGEPKYGSPNKSHEGYGPSYETLSPTHRYKPDHGTSSPTRHQGNMSPNHHYKPDHGTSSPTRHHGISSPTHPYKPDHGTSSPTRQYGPNHGNSSPTHHYGPNYGNSSPTRHYEPVEAVDKFPDKLQTEASRPIKNSNLSNPNKYGSSNPTHNYNSENKWQSAGPPASRHPLSTPTNDIDEALGFLEESLNLGPKRGGRARGGREPERRFPKPAFGTGNAIDSQEAMWKYHGARVP